MPRQDNKGAQTGFAFFRGRKDLDALRRHMRENGMFGGALSVLRRVPARLNWLAYYRYHRYFDRSFDRQYGVDTCGMRFQENLTVAGDNQAHALEYEPTPVRAFGRMLSILPEDLSEFTFVDFGSGKGRSLLLASHYGFKKIVGVEFAKELHERSLENVRNYRAPDRRCTDVEPILQDAATFEVPEGPCVFYFYYPFRRDVMTRVLANIERAYAAAPRKMYFINRLDKDDWHEEIQELFGRLGFVGSVPAPPALLPWLITPFRIDNYESVP